MGVLRSVPLPLRIAAIFLLGLVLFQLVGKVPASVFVTLAIVFWLIVAITWAYDQGWLNPLARVPGVSGALGFLANRSALAGPTTRPTAQAGSTPPGELSEKERQELFVSAQQTLSALRGNEDAKGQIVEGIIARARENPRNPFSSTAPATIIFVVGPSGVGKTTLARAIPNMLTGVSALRTAKIVTVRETELRGGEFGSVIELAKSKTRSARTGTLLLDDADWLLSQDPYGTTDAPGRDFGLTVFEAVSEFPQEVLIVATMSFEAYARLKADPKHERWLGRLKRVEVILEDLDDDALVDVLEKGLSENGWRFDGSDAKLAARRMMSEYKTRKAQGFQNAVATSRAAELLIEIANERYPNLSSTRRIDRAVVKDADKEID